MSFSLLWTFSKAEKAEYCVLVDTTLALAFLESPSSVAGEPRPGSAAQVRPAFSASCEAGWALKLTSRLFEPKPCAPPGQARFGSVRSGQRVTDDRRILFLMYMLVRARPA
ncbi:unnamed protein product [Leuciscus chuanchicus]